MFFKRQKKSQSKQASATEPSYIASDTTFEGNVICDGEIHIDGAVRGAVRAQTCLVDLHGEVHGELIAHHVFIRGRVVGPVTGTHVTIQAGAHVEGNITHETISIENGAYIYGTMRQGGISANQITQTPAPSLLGDSYFSKTSENTLLDETSTNVRPLKIAKP